MAAYDTLRSAIDNYIKTNGNKEITGAILNDILNAMITALGADVRFAGVATPSTNPGNPEGNVVYFASQAGTYSNFGGIVLPLGIHILLWNGTTWTSQTWFAVDNTPTQNSSNLATSGGILQAIVDAVGVERLRAIGVEVTSCSFDGTTKKISFFNSADDTLFQLDATAFVIDGMVSDVKIEDGNLVIQFNTDAGKQDIEIPLTDIFNPANYYTKTAIDELLALYYTKTETDALLTAINNKLADGCLYRGMAEPTTNPPTPTTKVFYIATKAGTYTNFGNIAVTEGITILKYDGSNWSKEQISYSDGVFDISAYNGTSYADLSAALGNNGANIPQNLRKGGMSVKYVQTYDNKYVQWRLMSDTWSIVVDNWQGVDDEPTVGSDNLVKSGGVFNEIDAINTKFNGGTFTGSFEYPNYKPTIDNLNILAGKLSVTISTDTASYFGYKLFDESDNVLAEVTDLLVGAGETVTSTYGVQDNVRKVVFTSNTSTMPFTVTIMSDSGLDTIVPSMQNDIMELKDDVQDKVSKDYGKNLLNECIKGKAFQGGNIVDASDMFGITNPVYFNGHDAITCNNCAIGGYYAVIYGQNDSIIGTILFSNWVTTIKKADYIGAVYVRFTIFTDILGSQRGAIKTQIQYGENVTSWCPNSDIQGKQIEYHEVTCNSDTSSGADFTGNDAIKNAIASITDASYFKRYILKCTGEFKGTKPSDYSIDPYDINPQYAMFWLKDYIYLDGGNAQDCIISGTLPDSLAECQADTPTFVKADYGVYQPLFLAHYPAQIKNITLIARNTRYPLHIDPANNPGAWYGDTLVENCRLIHEGKYGDSIGTVGGSPSGFGFANGAKYTFRKCLFMGGGLYYHDTPIIDTKIRVVFEDCQVVFKEPAITRGISVINFNNTIGSSLTIRNCQLPKNSFLYFENTAVASGNDDMVDINNVDFSSDGEPMPIYNGDNGKALRIESVADGASIRFDELSSAFNEIVGDSSRIILQETNRYNRHEQYGYQWRDGGTNVKGEAIGYRNLTKVSMGARLGNCSTTAKTLGIIVNGTTYSVVFNRDYTSVDNETILEELNAVLDGVAIASLYLVCRDYYPTFRHTSWYPVDDSNSILSGMGVIFTSTGGVRRATSSDGYIDGIAIDTGISGGMIRIIEKGRMKFSNNNAPGIRVTSSTPNHWDIPYGTKLCIDSDNDGIFAVGNSNAVLRKRFDDSIEII